MNKNNLGWIVAGIIVMLVAGYFVFNHITEKNYNKGLLDGQISVVQEQMRTGNILIINNGTIQAIPITTICQGAQK